MQQESRGRTKTANSHGVELAASMPLSCSRLARGPRAGPHDGPMRAGGNASPSAGAGYEAPPPHKSGTGQLDYANPRLIKLNHTDRY